MISSPVWFLLWLRLMAVLVFAMTVSPKRDHEQGALGIVHN
jgi:hypothetical protein